MLIGKPLLAHSGPFEQYGNNCVLLRSQDLTHRMYTRAPFRQRTLRG